MTNHSLGHTLSCTLPVLRSLEGDFYSENEKIKKILSKIYKHCSDFDSYEEIIFTGFPGISNQYSRCRCCWTGGICASCGRDVDYIKTCESIINKYPEKCYGEWYAFNNPLNEFKKTDQLFIPQKMMEKWGLEWNESLIQIVPEWFHEFYIDMEISLLFNGNGYTKNTSYHFVDALLELIKSWQNIQVVGKHEIEELIWLINNAKTIITVDSDFYWLARSIRPDVILLTGNMEEFGASRSMSLGDINHLSPMKICKFLMNCL